MVGLCTFPLRQLDRPARSGTPAPPEFGTAFLFNELVESGPAGDRVREYLLTADVLTRTTLGEVALRADLIEPASAASDVLVLPQFGDLWSHRPDIGVAIMATSILHDHGRAKGRRWVTQEVTDGLAARAESVDRIDSQPTSAFVLGHRVGGPHGSRPLQMAVGHVIRDTGGVRFAGALPEGYVGAPVFVAGSPDGGRDGVALRCLGLLLPGGDDHPVATFDLIRAAVAESAP